MFDVIGENIAVIFILLVIMWMLQFAFTYIQMQKFYKRLKIIRQDGLTAVGMEGGRYKGRAYGVLTVGKDNKVIHAEKMSGWTNFAGLKSVPELVGLTLDEILDEERDLPITGKLQNAFRNAARDIVDAEKDKIGDEGAVHPDQE
jgi:DNA-binding transcriptional regulator of glucitol operon